MNPFLQSQIRNQFNPKVAAAQNLSTSSRWHSVRKQKLLILCVGACGQLWPRVARLNSSQVWLISTGGGEAWFNSDQPQTWPVQRKHEHTSINCDRLMLIWKWNPYLRKHRYLPFLCILIQINLVVLIAVKLYGSDSQNTFSKECRYGFLLSIFS